MVKKAARPPLAHKPQQILFLIVFVLGPFLVLPYVIWAWWVGYVSTPYIVLMFVGYLLTGLGNTIGNHRYVTHASFEFKEGKEWAKAALLTLANWSLEGSAKRWAEIHTKHHRYADQPGDPHSPYVCRADLKNDKTWLGKVFRTYRYVSWLLNEHAADVEDEKTWGAQLYGFAHAHMGWIFMDHAPMPYEYLPPRVLKDPMIEYFSKKFFRIGAFSFLIPILIGELIAWNEGQTLWHGIWFGFLIGGVLRMFVVHQVTWAVNSLGHMFGKRTYETEDESRNNMLVALLAFGEGWHNNHHGKPRSALHGTAWWNDVSFLVILLMKRAGLITKVIEPTKEDYAFRRGLSA